MSLHFQVYADFVLINGKPQLLGTSIYSTQSACSSLPFCPIENFNNTISRIFPTLEISHSYIAYLQGLYTDSPTTPPVLDSGQTELF
jgi:hypothetical protein